MADIGEGEICFPETYLVREASVSEMRGETQIKRVGGVLSGSKSAFSSSPTQHYGEPTLLSSSETLMLIVLISLPSCTPAHRHVYWPAAWAPSACIYDLDWASVVWVDRNHTRCSSYPRGCQEGPHPTRHSSSHRFWAQNDHFRFSVCLWRGWEWYQALDRWLLLESQSYSRQLPSLSWNRQAWCRPQKHEGWSGSQRGRIQRNPVPLQAESRYCVKLAGPGQTQREIPGWKSHQFVQI